MVADSFRSGGNQHEITVYPGPSDGKRYPVVIFFHGNWGLGPPFGQQIQEFAAAIAGQGYPTAVPKYYLDDEPHPTDQATKEAVLKDAVAHVRKRDEADQSRLGLVGFSLGAASAMTFIAEMNAGAARVLVDFYGFLTQTIRANVDRFPPTVMFHNERDWVVPLAESSKRLDALLPPSGPNKLWTYDEHYPPAHHAFKRGGAADVDSRMKATAWLRQHMPPTGV